MIISIDSGNKNIKTEHYTLPTALNKQDSCLNENSGDVIQYEGMYYVNDGERLPIVKEKYTDENHFVLALFGIAKEIEKRIEDGKLERNKTNSYEVTLLNGLPPKHYQNKVLRKAFKNYFLKDKSVTFKYKGLEYHIRINEVWIGIQGMAAAMTVSDLISPDDDCIVVDIGGYTVDVLKFSEGKVDQTKVISADMGVNKLFQNIKIEVQGLYNTTLTEKRIRNIIEGHDKSQIKLDDKIKDFIRNSAENHVRNMLGTLEENNLNFNTSFTLFVGGGSITLKDYIEKSSYLGSYKILDQEEDIRANAKGYKLMFRK